SERQCVFYRCLVFFILPRPPTSTLFPYTTLFRSSRGSARQRHRLLDRIHQNRQGSRFGPPFHVVNLIHRRQIERVRCQSVKSVRDRKSTRLNSSHVSISYAVFCLKKKSTLISFIA